MVNQFVDDGMRLHAFSTQPSSDKQKLQSLRLRAIRSARKTETPKVAAKKQ